MEIILELLLPYRTSSALDLSFLLQRSPVPSSSLVRKAAISTQVKLPSNSRPCVIHAFMASELFCTSHCKIRTVLPVTHSVNFAHRPCYASLFMPGLALNITAVGRFASIYCSLGCDESCAPPGGSTCTYRRTSILLSKSKRRVYAKLTS